MLTNYYNPNQGLSVISKDGFQRYTEALDSYSKILSSFKADVNASKFCIDSAWESANIYYCASDEVRKINFNGELLNSLELNNPVSVSVVQNNYIMAKEIEFPPPQEQGCWIYDEGSEDVIKTDNELNEIIRINNIVGPSVVISDIDGGCFISDDDAQTVSKVLSDGTVIATQNYSDFPGGAINSIREMRTFKYSSTENGLWILSGDKIFQGTYNSEEDIFDIAGYLAPLEEVSSSSSEIEQDRIAAIDVDRNSNELYVCGGDGSYGWIIKYNLFGMKIVEKSYLDIAFPYVIKVVQGFGSNTVYILADQTQWDKLGYGSSSSSSSSSSYIQKWSSSSSSSNSSSSSDSSSSSS